MLFRYGALAILAAGFGLAAPDHDKPGKKAATAGPGTVGCLTKGATAGDYILTLKNGRTLTVKADAGVDLEKHAANHTVKLTGKRQGKTFNAAALEHVSGTCDITAEKK